MPAKNVEGSIPKNSVLQTDKICLCHKTQPNQNLPQECQQLPSQFKNPSLQSKIQLITPVKKDRLHYWLQGYDEQKIQFLVKGFTFGFKIPFQGKRMYRFSKNLTSAQDNISILKNKIQTEINNNRVGGPFKSKPFQNIQISPLGLVPN